VTILDRSKTYFWTCLGLVCETVTKDFFKNWGPRNLIDVRLDFCGSLQKCGRNKKLHALRRKKWNFKKSENPKISTVF